MYKIFIKQIHLKSFIGNQYTDLYYELSNVYNLEPYEEVIRTETPMTISRTIKNYFTMILNEEEAFYFKLKYEKYIDKIEEI